MANKIVLGVDHGTTSLGYVLIEENEKNEAVKLIECGVRIFKPVYEPKSLGLKNQTRTEKRQTRRQRDRRKRRLSKVENLLIKSGLLSKSMDSYHEDNNSIQASLGNPYKLRHDALSKPLKNDEVAYAILHLFKRRGFYSPLKSKTAEEKKNDALSQDIMIKVKDAGCQTLGEYFWLTVSHHSDKRIRGGESENSILNNEKLLRDNLYDELELIIEKQIEFGNTLFLSKDNKTNKEIRSELLKQFRFQRPLKSQKRKSFCALERKKASFKDKKTGEMKKREIGIKTAHKMTVPSQQFIIWQSINNLKIEEMDHETGEVYRIDIDLETKQKLFDKAWGTLELKFQAIRKELGLSEHSMINLEFGNKKGIQGNQLLKLFKKDLGKWFKNLTIEKQTQLISEIHMIKGAEYLGLRKRLVNTWGLDDVQVDLLITALSKELQPQYLSVSNKAITKLLPELEKGRMFHEAKEMVYSNRNQTEINKESLLPPFPVTMNPIVNKSITEVRKVVNELIKKHGAIDIVRVELARDLGLSSKGLAELRSKNAKNEKLNTAAVEFLRKNSVAVNFSNIEKYKLWQETNQKSLFPEKIGGRWVYKTVSFDELFGASGKYEIEHLLPRSETGDNSFMNKSICSQSVNALKGQRTPYEYYQSVMTKDELDSWIKEVYRTLGDSPKKKRFVMTRGKMLEGISAKASLNDTRYIATELKDYLSIISDNVQATKGGFTAMMRRELGLNKLLGNEAKKSRLDHRHHMVDALAIALTNNNTMKNLTEIRRLKDVEVRKKSPLYNSLHQKIKNRYKIEKDFNNMFEKTVTSHEVENKASGGFDEETVYSMMDREVLQTDDGTINYSKLSKIKLNEINDVSDIDKEEYKDCVFVTSKSASEIIGKKVIDILNMVCKGTISLPFEVIEHLRNMKVDSVLEKPIILKSGHPLKKIKYITAKPNSNTCHTMKNREGKVIAFKKLGNNFCIVGYSNGTPRVVSLFEYLNNKDIDKKDVIFKGSVLQDEAGDKWKVYKFSGNEVAVHPVNNLKIESRDLKKHNIKMTNVIRKSFSYYLKNNIFII